MTSYSLSSQTSSTGNPAGNTGANSKSLSHTKLEDKIIYLNQQFRLEENFDLISRNIEIGGRKACFYFVNGFCKDELMQKLLQQFMEMKPEDMPDNIEQFAEKYVPYIEVEITREYPRVFASVLSGQLVLLLEGYEGCLLIDSRTYPARGVDEPEKDKVLRGSKDGFVETLTFNTALIRRRIRNTDLTMEIKQVGVSSKTDVVICYMKKRVDMELLQRIEERIDALKVDALSMNQESLAECLFRGKWFNPFPKFKYSERPDTAAAQILEGDIVILVDNSPYAMIVPSSIFDIIDEADDYYLPPLTGTYLRLTRFLIALVTYFLTPTYLLLMQNQEMIPEFLRFIIIQDQSNVPIVIQFFLLELAIDGLKLAAINTPNMLSTPLSIMAGLVLSEFAVKSGWFNTEVLLYMAFVAIANYTQSNYELGYALKFMRMLTLLLTFFFNKIGFVVGVVISVVSLCMNKTISGKSFIYPLIPFDGKKLLRRFIRFPLRSEE
ncbi:MAG: spore germination protein [Lachnospiraceae bacterium]|nr:spore germination protein [Clostridiales bacterium]MDY3108700.1 spore germination protein [Lachnospiraceae bacterium]